MRILFVVSILASLLNLFPTFGILIEVNKNFGSYYFIIHIISLILVWSFSSFFQKCEKVLLSLILVVLLVHYGVILSPFFLPSGDQHSGKSDIKVLYANLWVENQDLQKLSDLIEDRDPDILCLLEFTPEFEKSLDLERRYSYSRVYNAKADVFSYGFYSKFPIVGDAVVDLGGDAAVLPPVFIGDLQHPSGKIIKFGLIHAYPPHAFAMDDNRLLLRRFATKFRHVEQDLIVVGDINATPFSKFYQTLADGANLKNAMEGEGYYRTWSARSSLFRIPIDHVFYRGDFVKNSFEVLPGIGSDHFPLMVELSFLDDSHKSSN